MTIPRQPCGGTQNARRVVLLVEDEPFVRDATCRTLEKAGFEVLPVGDAQQAMQAYEHRQGKIDLLMTDMTLPGRSGRELSQDLHISSTEIPVLLTSGYIENDWERQPPEARVYFLPKPYSRADLVQALEKIFAPAAQRKLATQAS